MVYRKYMCLENPGAYLATRDSQNLKDNTPERETTPKLKCSKFADFDKQIVYIGVIDPAESKSYISAWPTLSL